MDIATKYYHWLWGDNQLRPDKPNYIINLEHQIVIQFDHELAMFADYEVFRNHVIKVHFLSGANYPEDQKEQLITDAYNYLAFEERQLEEDNLGTRDADEFGV